MNRSLRLATLLLLVAPPLRAEPSASAERWLFLGLHAGGEEAPVALISTAELQLLQALRRQGTAFIETRAVWPAQQKKRQTSRLQIAEAHRLFKAGLAAYLDMQMGKATQLLRRARQIYTRQLHQLSDPRPFLRCSLYLAMANLSDGKERPAEAVLEDLVRLAPLRPEELEEFPPRLSELVEAIRERLADQPLVRMEVRTEPANALVFLDGRLVGRSPLIIKGLMPGHHTLRVEALGHAPLAQAFTASPQTSRTNLKLKPLDLDRGASAFLNARRQGKGRAELVALARSLAAEASIDQLVLAYLDTDQEAVQLVAGRYDAASGDFVSVGLTRTPPGKAAMREAVHTLADALGSELPSLDDLEAREAFFGSPGRSVRRNSGHPLLLSVSLGAGLGWAGQVTQPGLAIALVPVFVELGYRLEPAMELSLLLRAQIVEPRAWLLLPRLTWRPGGPDGNTFLTAGIPWGHITHSIADTDNGRPSVAGFSGISLGAGVRAQVSPRLALSTELLLYSLLPAFTVHADARAGVLLTF